MSGRMLILLLAAAVGATTAPFGHAGHSPDPSASLPPSPVPSPVTSASTAEAPVDAPFYARTLDEGVARLIAGRLSSRAFEVVTGGQPFGSGPVDGKVLAWWGEEDEPSRLALVDTDTGAMRPLYERRNRSLEAALSPDGDTAYWVEQTRRVRGVFRLRLDGASEPERIADGWDGLVVSMTWSTDGTTLVLGAFTDTRPGATAVVYDYRLLDTVAGTLSDPIDFRGHTVVGLHGDDLIVYAIDPDEIEELGYLASVDVTSGEVTQLLGPYESSSARIADDAGTPVLVVSTIHDGRHGIDRMALDGSDRRPLWTSDESVDDSSVTLVSSSSRSDVEAPGWVLAAADSIPYPAPDDRPGGRLLVSVADGTVVELPSPPPVSEPGEQTVGSPLP